MSAHLGTGKHGQRARTGLGEQPPLVLGKAHMPGVLLEDRAEDGLLPVVATLPPGRHCSVAQGRG